MGGESSGKEVRSRMFLVRSICAVRSVFFASLMDSSEDEFGEASEAGCIRYPFFSYQVVPFCKK